MGCETWDKGPDMQGECVANQVPQKTIFKDKVGLGAFHWLLSA